MSSPHPELPAGAKRHAMEVSGIMQDTIKCVSDIRHVPIT
jgi:hypothetical protein